MVRTGIWLVRVISHCSPSIFADTPLTVENVCVAVQEVEWTVLRRLIPRDKYREIRQLQNTSNENRLRAVVECWLSGGEAAGQQPSWRRLIWTLDGKDHTRNADMIRHFAEPIVGNISHVTPTVSTVSTSVCTLQDFHTTVGWLLLPFQFSLC